MTIPFTYEPIPVAYADIVRAAPRGKAARFPLSQSTCTSLNILRNSIANSCRNAGVSVATKIQDDAVYVWRKEVA